MAGSSKTLRFSGGRLIASPTDLSDPTNNCGGTQLGTVIDCKMIVTHKIDPITAEEFGGAMIDGIYLDSEVVFDVLGTNFDADFVERAFYGGSSAGGRSVVNLPFTPGALVSSKGVTLLWLPNDEAVDQALLINNAFVIELPKPIYFSGQKPAAVRAQFFCARNASNAVFSTDLLANLSL